MKRGHTCAYSTETFPPELKWRKSRNRDYCLNTEVNELKNNGHNCAQLDYEGNVKKYGNSYCIVNYHADIKNDHQCAILDADKMTIICCNKQPCLQIKINEILHNGHTCAKIDYNAEK